MACVQYTSKSIFIVDYIRSRADSGNTISLITIVIKVACGSLTQL